MEEKLLSDGQFNFLCVIGFWAFSCWCYDNFKSLFSIILSVLSPYFLPSENKSLSERYGKWAGEIKV